MVPWRITCSRLLILAILVLTLGGRYLWAADNQHESQEADLRVPVSTGKYVTGGVLGTVVGFGIGHGIQGRYSESKALFKFTLPEIAGWVLIIDAASKCSSRSTKKDYWGNETKDCGSEGSELLLGVGALLGFHIWEIVDVWSGAKPISDEEKPKSMKTFIIPTDKSIQLKLAWNF